MINRNDWRDQRVRQRDQRVSPLTAPHILYSPPDYVLIISGVLFVLVMSEN